MQEFGQYESMRSRSVCKLSTQKYRSAASIETIDAILVKMNIKKNEIVSKYDENKGKILQMVRLATAVDREINSLLPSNRRKLWQRSVDDRNRERDQLMEGIRIFITRDMFKHNSLIYKTRVLARMIQNKDMKDHALACLDSLTPFGEPVFIEFIDLMESLVTSLIRYIKKATKRITVNGIEHTFVSKTARDKLEQVMNAYGNKYHESVNDLIKVVHTKLNLIKLDYLLFTNVYVMRGIVSNELVQKFFTGEIDEQTLTTFAQKEGYTYLTIRPGYTVSDIKDKLGMHENEDIFYIDSMQPDMQWKLADTGDKLIDRIRLCPVIKWQESIEGENCRRLTSRNGLVSGDY
jgi:hypothetical protein